MKAAKELYDNIGDAMEGAHKGKMFGAECLKAENGKALAFFYHGDMVFKLTGDAYNEAMAYDGAHLFNPMGNRPMGGWVQLPYDYADQWSFFVEQAFAYVSSLPANSKKKKK